MLKIDFIGLMPWPEPQISFQAFGLFDSSSKFIVSGLATGKLVISNPAASIDGPK